MSWECNRVTLPPPSQCPKIAEGFWGIMIQAKFTLIIIWGQKLYIVVTWANVTPNAPQNALASGLEGL